MVVGGTRDADNHDRIYFQYLTTAVLALYRRLLVASDVSQVREDVQILEDTAGIFARLSTTNAERGNFFAPYKIAENFVSKITALAKESIMRSPLNGSTQEDRET